MTSDPPHPPDPRAMLAHVINRRRFLTMLGGVAAAGAIGCSPPESGRNSNAQDGHTATAQAADVTLPMPSSADSNRRLVVIEMQGGNDGLAMLQPYQSGPLQSARPQLVSADEDLIDAGNGFGWHPALAGLAELGIAGVVGVGSVEPDFSHFEMEQRWWRGVSEDNSRVGTGFFGRVCDQLDIGEPVTGLSFAGGPTQALASEKAITVGLSDPGAGWFFGEDDPWYQMLRATYANMAESSPGDDVHFATARSGLANTVRFAQSLSQIESGDDDIYPWTDLGQQLRFAAEVLTLDVGVRVMHVGQGGYDTHTGQEWRHRELMTELNDATVAFVNDLRDRGQLDDTLIMTTSEFGRRVSANDGGTDHGGASTMLVCGGGATGVHGDAPSLTRLDDGNLVATARFEDYYATIAQDWFGISPDDVLPTSGTPITGLL